MMAGSSRSMNSLTSAGLKPLEPLTAFCHKLTMSFQPAEFIERHQWTFAKTMPGNPHEYVVRKKVDSETDFDAFVRYIRANGEPRAWGKGRSRRLYFYWQHDGYLYWTMGWPVDETIIINRARVEDSTAERVSAEDEIVIPWSSKNSKRPPL